MNSPSLRLKTYQKRLEDIFELLNTWQLYIDAVYMSDFESALIETVAKDEE